MAEVALIKRNNNHAAQAAGQIRAGRFDAAAAQQQSPFLLQLLSCEVSAECTDEAESRLKRDSYN